MSAVCERCSDRGEIVVTLDEYGGSFCPSFHPCPDCRRVVSVEDAKIIEAVKAINLEGLGLWIEETAIPNKRWVIGEGVTTFYPKVGSRQERVWCGPTIQDAYAAFTAYKKAKL